jgi:hypothetical protein
VKIVICFDPSKIENLNLGKEDYVLVNSEIKSNSFNVIQITEGFINYKEYKDGYDLAIEDYFKSHSLNDSVKKLIESISPGLYLHNLRFCVFWIKCFNEILNDACTEIIFTDYVDDLSYFPYYEAEGEINRKLFYCNYDFISAQIFKYAELHRNSNLNCKITILKKHSKINLKIRIFLRRYFLFVVKVFFHLYKIVTTKNISGINNFKNSYIVSTRSVAHSLSLKRFLAKNDNCLVHACEGLLFSSPNQIFLKGKSNNIISQYQTLYIIDLIKAISACIKLYINCFKLVSVEINGGLLHMKSICIEGAIMHLESELYARSLYNLCKNNKKIKLILTSENISPYPIWLKDRFINTNIKVFQIQTIGIDQLPLPNFLFSDLFLCDSFKVYNFFSRVFPHYLSKLAYWGSLNYEKKMLVKKKHLRKIIYFTQPYELNEQVRFVNFLISETIKRDIHLYIKPHPREDIKRLLSNIEQHVIVLPKSYSFEDYSNCCDLAILRTSSITQDLILEGIPVLNVLISNFDRTVKLDFLNPLNINVISDYSSIIGVLDSYKSYTERYYEFRVKYLEEQGITKSVEDFSNSLNIFEIQ